ncbi:MAG: hypothetical protein R3F49_07290 [Planctomycetota bacterium]
MFHAGGPVFVERSALACVGARIQGAVAEGPARTDALREQSEQPERRLVLVLSDATAEDVQLCEDAPAALYEMPLQRLGLLVERRSLDAGPPPRERIASARAVVLHLGCARETPLDLGWLDAWLVDEVLPAGARIVLLNNMGPLALPGGRTFAALGLQPSEQWSDDPLQVSFHSERVGRIVEDTVVAPVFDGVLAASLPGQVWVRASLEGAPDVAPVATGPLAGGFGGIALAPYVVRAVDEAGGQRWRLDLFDFFREALALDGMPAVDPVVINGRRAMFVQVDGDGFESYSTVRAGAMSAEVFRDSLIQAFPLPFTVSVIVASVTESLRPEACDPRMELASSIFAQPNVVVASHSVLHPLLWNEPWRPDAPPRTITWYSGLEHYEYDPVEEVRQSIRFIDDYLVPAGKRCGVMLWSGDALPPADAVRAARDMGCVNVNGATCRWDDAYNSIRYILPHVRWFEDELQVYCGAANENVFDGFYEHLPGAFGHIETTIERAGRGPILKPANLYLHFYSAERPARLAVAQRLLHRFGIQEETAPIFASEWAEIAADAALRPRLSREADGWSVDGLSAARTVRFDDETRDVDLARSRNVLGARRMGGALYVHLTAMPARIVLATAPLAQVHLEYANHRTFEAERRVDAVAWRASSAAAREAVVAGFAPGAPVVVVVGARHEDLTADERGRVMIVLPPGNDRIEVAAR